MTGRMVTLAWNPPRSLDMAIGGSGLSGLWGEDGTWAGSGRGTEGARLAGTAQRSIPVEGRSG